MPEASLMILDLDPRGYFQSLREGLGSKKKLENRKLDKEVLVHKLFSFYELTGLDIPLMEIRRFSLDEINEELSKVKSLVDDARREQIIDFDLALQDNGTVVLKKKFSKLDLRDIYQRMDTSQLADLYKFHKFYGHED